MAERLTPAQVQERLRTLTGWELTENRIEKEFTWRGFPEAIAFVGRVADLAEAAGHHPDIDIRYRRVRLILTTHSAGGLTEKDFRLAEQIDAMARRGNV